MFRRLRAAIRLLGMIVVTAAASAPPALLRLVLGAEHPRTVRLGSRCSRVWGAGMCRVMGIRRRVEGAPGEPPFVVAANHVSYLDIIVLSSVYPGLFVAKREIADWPIFGWINRSCGTLFVDRERPRDVLRVSELMRRRIEDGATVTLFPEGKATRGAEVLPFLPSLLQTPARMELPCYAASLGYDADDRFGPPSATVCWWGGVGFLPHLWRLLQLPGVEARIRFAERPVRLADRKELARVLHGEVVRRFAAVRQPADYSREISQTEAPSVSHGSRPSSQRSGSGEKVRSVK